VNNIDWRGSSLGRRCGSLHSNTCSYTHHLTLLVWIAAETLDELAQCVLVVAIQCPCFLKLASANQFQSLCIRIVALNFHALLSACENFVANIHIFFGVYDVIFKIKLM
jgi:hypothetical protein